METYIFGAVFVALLLFVVNRMTDGGVAYVVRRVRDYLRG